MKKNIIFLVLFIFFNIEQVVAEEKIDTLQASPCAIVNIDWIKTHLPLPQNSKVIHKAKTYGGLCEVVLEIGGEVAPLYAGNDFIIAGQMIKEKDQITSKVLQSLEPVIKKTQALALQEEQRRQSDQLKKIKNNFSKIKEMVGIEYIPSKTATKRIYVITDPLCGYCIKTLNFLKPLADKKNFVISIITFPIFGEQSIPLVNKALKQKFSMEEYVSSTWKTQDYSGEKKCNQFLKIKKLGDENFPKWGFNAVPVILGENGSFMVIGADLQKIEENINNIY